MTGYREDTQERRQQAGRCQEDVSRYAETSLHISVQYFLHATSLALGFLSQHALFIGSIQRQPVCGRIMTGYIENTQERRRCTFVSMFFIQNMPTRD